MKKVFLFIISVLLIVVAADVILGYASIYYVKHHDLPGRYQPLDRLVKKVTPDILFLGNSIMQNSVDPTVVEDSTGLTCYNGGIDGQGMDFFEAAFDCVLQRHTPRIFMLGIRAEEMGNNIGEGIFDVLRPYYHIGYPSIDEHFDKASTAERILLQSSLYRYNTVWARIFLYSLFDHTVYSPNGFLSKETPKVFPALQELNSVDTPVQWKTECLERMLKKCKEKGIRAIVCFPPELYSFPISPPPCVAAVMEICKKYSFECYADFEDTDFQNAPELFADNVHLNTNGAAVYSKIIASRLAQGESH